MFLCQAACQTTVCTPFPQATIGIDFLSKTMYLEDRTVRLQLWCASVLCCAVLRQLAAAGLTTRLYRRGSCTRGASGRLWHVRLAGTQPWQQLPCCIGSAAAPAISQLHLSSMLQGHGGPRAVPQLDPILHSGLVGGGGGVRRH